MKKFLIIILTAAILLASTSCQKKVEPPNEEEGPIQEERIIGTWLNYNEIKALIESADTEENFEKLISEKILRMKEFHVNTIFLHTRAFDDCFYSSSQFPVSKYCSDSDGKLKFDVLKCFLRVGHSQNIKIHAWINPYRISSKNDITELPEGYLPKRWFSEDSENQRLIICDNGIYYNPASLEVQKHIIDGVREIITNYDVDGVHFDDYFYPTSSPTVDSDYYSEYLSGGGSLTLTEYRRQCVNSMISAVYSVIKSHNKSLIFSVSPSGSIENDMNGCFADVRLWAKKKGYVDYLIPQIYYGFENEKYPFKSTVEDWLSITDEGAMLLIGLPLYKTGATDKYAGTGAEEWTSNNDVIARQIAFIQGMDRIKGFSYYSASTLYSENLSEIQQKELTAVREVLTDKMEEI